MQKIVVVVVLLVALTLSAGAQNMEFLAKLMKAVVEEYGIETVIEVLEDLGYVGDGEVTIQETSVASVDLTVNHAIWDQSEDEIVDAVISLMSDTGNEDCWTYVQLGTSEYVSASQRMEYRAKFINDCIIR